MDPGVPPATGGSARERWESLDALAGLADQLVAASPQARLGDLVREIDERIAAAHAPSVDGVTLASLHAAKGLEWDVVILAGCSDGLIPITMADSARRSTRSAGCSMSASPGPDANCT